MTANWRGALKVYLLAIVSDAVSKIGTMYESTLNI